MIALSLLLLSNPAAEGIFLAVIVGISLIGSGAAVITEGRLIFPSGFKK
jgi:uncharacterized membrane protein HdeD (DUF308 family)